MDESGWIEEIFRKQKSTGLSIGLDVGGKGNVVVKDDTFNDFP